MAMLAVATVFIMNSDVFAQTKWETSDSTSCKAVCDDAGMNAVSSGTFANGETFYICALKTDADTGKRGGYNLVQQWSPNGETCYSSSGNRMYSSSDFDCLCEQNPGKPNQSDDVAISISVERIKLLNPEKFDRSGKGLSLSLTTSGVDNYDWKSPWISLPVSADSVKPPASWTYTSMRKPVADGGLKGYVGYYSIQMSNDPSSGVDINTEQSLSSSRSFGLMYENGRCVEWAALFNYENPDGTGAPISLKDAKPIPDSGLLTFAGSLEGNRIGNKPRSGYPQAEVTLKISCGPS